MGLNFAATVSIRSIGDTAIRDNTVYQYAVDRGRVRIAGVDVEYETMSYFRIKQVAWDAFTNRPLTGIGLDRFHAITEAAFRRRPAHRAVPPHRSAFDVDRASRRGRTDRRRHADHSLGRDRGRGPPITCEAAPQAHEPGDRLRLASAASFYPASTTPPRWKTRGADPGSGGARKLDSSSGNSGESSFPAQHHQHAWIATAAAAALLGTFVNTMNADVMNFRFAWVVLDWCEALREKGGGGSSRPASRTSMRESRSTAPNASTPLKLHGQAPR